MQKCLGGDKKTYIYKPLSSSKLGAWFSHSYIWISVSSKSHTNIKPNW
jgi:hypothetical protein